MLLSPFPISRSAGRHHRHAFPFSTLRGLPFASIDCPAARKSALATITAMKPFCMTSSVVVCRPVRHVTILCCQQWLEHSQHTHFGHISAFGVARAVLG